MSNQVDINVCGCQGLIPYTYKTVVLKPNVIDGKNMLTQGMMDKPNTKYVIKHDFVISDAVVTKSAKVLSTNVSQCGNAAYAVALANYNAAHEAWIEADNAYTNDPNDTTLAAKNAAYDALQAAQATLTGTPQYYYFAGTAINLTKGQHVSVPDGCVLLNGTLNGLADFELAPSNTTVYVGSAVTGTYEYTVLNGIEIPANCLIEFDGGSISDGVLVGDETILIYDQEVDIVLKNVTLLRTFEQKEGSVNVNKKDNTDGMGIITLKKSKGFAKQLTQENTIYRILYDFDLDGETIIIPANCILQFDGGSLSNGTVVGNNTKLDGNVKCFATIDGTFDNSYLDVTWFGAKGDDNFDNTSIIDNVLRACVNSKANLYFPKGVYASKSGDHVINTTISAVDNPDITNIDKYYDFNNIVIYGDGYSSVIKSYFNGDIICIFCGKNLNIENLCITSGLGSTYRGDGHGQNLISLIDVVNINIRKCLLINAYWEFDRTYYDGGQGITCQGDVFINVNIEDCDVENCSSGINLYTSSDLFNSIDGNYYHAGNVRIKKCFSGVFLVTNIHVESPQRGKTNAGLIHVQARCTDCAQALRTQTLCGAVVDIQAVSTQNIEELSTSGYGTPWINDGESYASITDIVKAVWVAQLYDICNCNISIQAYYKYVNFGYYLLGKNKILNYIFNCENNVCNLSLNEDVSVVKRIGASEITDEELLKVWHSDAYSPYFKSSTFILNGLGDNVVDKFYKANEASNSLVLIVNGKLFPLLEETAVLKFRMPGGTNLNTLYSHHSCIIARNDISNDGIYPCFGSSLPNGNPTDIQIAFNGNGDLLRPSVESAPGLVDTPAQILAGGGGIPVRSSTYPHSILGFIPVGVGRTRGGSTTRPSLGPANGGFLYFDSSLGRPLWWNGYVWKDANNIMVDTPTSGTFADKPRIDNYNIPVGFRYFCTDRHIGEDAEDGMPIYHKGSNVWVDAFGKVVS